MTWRAAVAMRPWGRAGYLAALMRRAWLLWSGRTARAGADDAACRANSADMSRTPEVSLNLMRQ